MSLRDIERRLGVSRNTVTRHLVSQYLPRYKQREARATKLEPSHDFIRQRMDAAAPDWIAAPALLRKLYDLGYSWQCGVMNS